MTIFAVLLLVLSSTASVPPQASTDREAQPFRVNLQRLDNQKASVFSGFDFEVKSVTEAVQKYPVKLPQPMPSDAQLGYFYGGPIFAILQKTPGQTKVRFTMDANANFDLTDDSVMELSPDESGQNKTLVKIARPFGGATPRTDWLPYRIDYSQYKNRQGAMEDSVSICADYAYEGEFRLEDRDYILRLMDGDARGRFVREKLVNVYFTIQEKGKTGPIRDSHRFFELIPIENRLYEVKDFAEDGGWIEFIRSPLPPAALGQSAPDMELTDTTGKKIRLSDYRGKLLLLDFWPSWCKPCVAEFAEIKKIIQQYPGNSLGVIGVNIDKAARLDAARKVISDFDLPWPQIMDGKGEFIPVYQIYGRLPERMNSFPAYVAIDEKGIARYATNDFKKMTRFLHSRLAGDTAEKETLFIPLQSQMIFISALGDAVDFSPQKVEEILRTHSTQVPADLPVGSRIGLLSNGTLLIASPGSSENQVRLIVDSERDFDFKNNTPQEIPILRNPNPTKKEAVDIRMIISFESGGRRFFPFSFFAVPGKDGGLPDIRFFGMLDSFQGTIFEGDREYRIEIADPTPDFIFSKEDLVRPDILKLSIKKDGRWEAIHKGSEKIPIGGRFYKLRFVSDDGALVELEREK